MKAIVNLEPNIQHFTYEYKMLLDYGAQFGGLVSTFGVIVTVLTLIFTSIFVKNFVHVVRNNLTI